MKSALQKFLKQHQHDEDQLHALLHDINFALWYLHEAENLKNFDFDEFMTHLDHLCKERVVNSAYLSELWDKGGVITDIIHYFEMKKKRYVEFS